LTFKVQVGPPQIAIPQGRTVLVSDPDGGIASPSVNGLYFYDTLLGLRLGGQSLDLRFWREGDTTLHEVLKGDQAAVLRRRRDEIG
jgi:hypothetical protein